MNEKRFVLEISSFSGKHMKFLNILDNGKRLNSEDIVDLLNEQQELIEELQVSDEMGWKRAEHFEKKCPKELHNKKMYIKRLEYKVQKFKEENKQLKKEHKIAIDEMITDYKNLEKENEQLRKQVESSETTMNATSHYNAFLESKITTLEQENEELRKENKDLNDMEWEKFKKKYHLE